jgi:hypothetical protein
MKKNNSNFIIFILSISVLGLFVLNYYFYDAIRKTGEGLADVSNNKSNLSKAEQEISELSTSASVLKPQIDLVNSYFIPSDGEVYFINKVEDIGRSFGLKVVVDSVGVKDDDVKASGLRYLNLKITSSGSWIGNYYFLHSIENLPYYVFVNEADFLNISNKELKTGVLWKGSFDIKVLQQK